MVLGFQRLGFRLGFNGSLLLADLKGCVLGLRFISFGF